MSREVRLSDRVKQLSFDPSTNAFALDSVATGFSPFRDFYENGDVVFYAATDGTRYEVGSGEYNNNTLTRYPLRSNNISSGPYFVDDASAHGATRGKEGHFYPLYLTKSAASGIKGFAGVANSVHEHKFSGFPGVTFYMPNTHAGHAVPAYHPGVSGQNYAVSGGPVDFQGVTEVFVTYPGKHSVFTGAGVSGFSEPRKAGIAFWGNEQTLDYDADIVWSTGENALGVSQTSPSFAVDVGGLTSYSQVRASGFIDGGSGVQFSGGQALPQSSLKTASGGRQLEPFFRNEVDTQTKSDQLLSLSGLVDQRILLQEQLKGAVFAGPASGCGSSCSPDYPEFRYLELEDIPDLSTLYVVQQNYVNYDMNIPLGAVAFSTASGKIEFDSGIRYDKGSNFLGIGINRAPTRHLEVGGDVGISGMLMVSGDAQFGGDIYAVGDLIVSGTRTYLDSTVVTMKDINVELASQSGNAINNDAAIDDAGLIVKSTNYDKKWTWKNATDAWTTTEKIDISGVIFLGDDSVISGAYKPGSGIAIHNVANGHRIDVGNIFYVSGTNSLVNTEHFLHQSDRLLVSGVSGIQTKVFGFDGPSGLLEINATALQNNVYDKIDASGNALSGVISSTDTLLSNRINASGNALSGVAKINETLIHASGNALSGIISSTDTLLSNRINASGNALSGVAKINETLIHASGNALSGVAKVNEALIHASGNALSGVISSTDTLLSNRINASGNAISGAIVATGVALSGKLELVDSYLSTRINESGGKGLSEASGQLFLPLSGYIDAKTGGLGGGYNHWKVSASGGANYNTHISDNISSQNALHFMGASGLVADYTAASNIFRFAAPGLSGMLAGSIADLSGVLSGIAILNHGIASASGNYLKDQIDTLGGGGGSLMTNWKIKTSGTNGTTPTTDSLSENATLQIDTDGIEHTYNSSSNLLTFTYPSGSILSADIIRLATSGTSQAAEILANSASGNFTTGSGLVLVGKAFHVAASGANLLATNNPVNGYVPSYNSTSGNFTWVANSVGGGGDGSAADILANSASGVNHAADIIRNSASGTAVLAELRIESASGTQAFAEFRSGFAASGLNIKTNVGDTTTKFIQASGLSVSGVMISGATPPSTDFMLYSDANGTLRWNGIAVSRPSFTGSGIITQGDVVDFRQDGSGTLRHLRFEQSVRLGDGAAVNGTNLEGTDPLGTGTPNSTFVGYAAGSGSNNLYMTSGIYIGEKAGALASGLNNSIFIGKRAGYHAIQSGAVPGLGTTDATAFRLQKFDNIAIGRSSIESSFLTDKSILIGTEAGFKGSGIEESVILGYQAAKHIVAAEGSVLIGEDVVTNATGVFDSIFIGKQAGSGVRYTKGSYGIGDSVLRHSSGNVNVNAFGWSAGRESLNNSYSLYLGQAAGQSSSGNHYNVAAGMDALKWSSGVQYSVVIGDKAGQQADYQRSMVSIGRYASWLAKDNYSSVHIGYFTGGATETSFENVYMGYLTAFGVSGVASSVAIGRSTLRSGGSADGVTQNITSSIFIGDECGYASSGVFTSTAIGTRALLGTNPQVLDLSPPNNPERIDYSIFMGYGAGSYTLGQFYPGSYNIIIEGRQTNYNRIDWASNYQDFILSIGSILHGYVEPTVSKNLMIGAKPASMTELQEATLSVKPEVQTATVLKLNRHNSQSADVLRTEVKTQIRSGSSQGGTSEQTIINKNGYLQIPKAVRRGSSGTGDAGEIYDENDNLIERIEGTIAVYAPIQGQHLYPLQFFVVCINTGSSLVWMKNPGDLNPI